ncbi:MAG: ATP-binding protein [Chitinophagales bacterium]
MQFHKASIVLLTFSFVFGLVYNILHSSESEFNKSCKDAQKTYTSFQLRFEELSQDSLVLNKAIAKDLDLTEIEALNSENFYFYIYEEGNLLFWNNSKLLPDIAWGNDLEEEALMVQKNGYYLSLFKDYGKYKLVAMLLLKSNYPIVNKYLSNSFPSPFHFDDNVLIQTESEEEGFALRNLKNESVCQLIFQEDPSYQASTSSLFFGFISLLSYWILIFFLLRFLVANYSMVLSFLVLLVSAILFKEIMLLFDFEFKKSILFSPELYASQLLGNSLGQLFTNAFIAFVIASFSWYTYYREKWNFKKITFLFFSFLVLGTFILFNTTIKSLVLDSVISFEMNNFTLISIYTLLGLVIIFLLSYSLILVYYLALKALLKFYPTKVLLFIFGFFLVSCISLFLLDYGIVSLLSSFASSLILLLIWFHLKNKLEYTKSNLSLPLLVACSFLIASGLIRYNTISEDYKKSIIANQLGENRDLITEYRFEDIEKDIQKDPFFKKFFISPLVTNRELQQRLSYLYFGGYMSKYNVNGYAFNLDGLPIKTSEESNLAYYYDLINKKGEDSFSDWLFLIPQNDGTSIYLSILPIENDGHISGTLVLELSLKTYHKENLYPELLIEQKSSPIAKYRSIKDYEYAIYKNNYLVSQAGEFPFPYQFALQDDRQKYPKIRVENNYRLNYFQTDDDTKIIITSGPSSYLVPISTFSYIFVLLGTFSLLAFVVFYSLNWSFQFIPRSLPSFTYKNKINAAIIAITIISFFTIGIVSLGYFSELYKSNNTDILIKKQQSVLSSIEYLFQKQALPIEENLPNNFTTEIASLSQIHAIDINIFNANGQLLSSSQPGIFGNGLVSKKIDPLALYYLQEENKERYIQKENIGSLNYESIYVPIRFKGGESVAYLNLPYFAQEETLRSELSKLMVALVNVYVLVLIVSIFLAILISNSLTRPLAKISKKFSLINLNANNEEIEWKSNDEIGNLVKEYNKMIRQIEESAQAMAKAERESAWREMARQIAHEIKNPLTPMKLGIQHLQRAIKEDPERVNELAERVSKTMVEQIDNLSEIASAFSSFAKMPLATKEDTDLLELIKNVIELFNQNEASRISLKSKLESALVLADKNQLISVFNNLIKNAQQACEDIAHGQVEIELSEEGDSFLIQVIDNGVGISEEQKSKVFVPNFTTKSSGTGLGLAISKQIIENHSGKIWFESKENQGTKFFVLLSKKREQKQDV